MGGDGGTKAVKRAYQRGALVHKKKEKTVKAARAAKRLTTCALSDEALRHPVVACRVGNLYNKEAVLAQLLRLSKKQPTVLAHDAFAHIRSMKDITPCNFTANPSAGGGGAGAGAGGAGAGGAGGGAGAGAGAGSNASAPVAARMFHAGAGAGANDAVTAMGRCICPVTMLELTPDRAFVVLWGSGRVLSAKALQEVPGLDGGLERVRLVPTDPAQVEAMKARALAVVAERARAKREKKERRRREKELKRKRAAGHAGGDDGAGGRGSGSGKASADDGEAEKKRQRKGNGAGGVGGAGAGAGGGGGGGGSSTSAVAVPHHGSAVYASLFNKKSDVKEDANSLFYGKKRGYIHG